MLGLRSLRERNPLPEGSIPVAIGLVVNGIATYVFLLGIASRALPADEYASLGVLWALLFTAGNGVMQPLEQEVARAVAERRAQGVGSGPIIRRATWIGLLFTSVLAVAGVVAGPWLVDHLFDGSVGLLVALLVGLLSFCVGHLVRGTLSSHDRFRAYGVFFGVDGVTRPIVGSGFALLGIEVVGAWGLLAAAAPFVGCAVALRGQHGLVEDGPDAAYRELSKALGWLLLGSVCTALLLNGGIVAVELLASAEQEDAAGVFLDGLVVARIPLFLFQAVLASLLPRLSHLAGGGEYDEFAEALRRLTIAILVLGVIAIPLAVTVGPAVVQAMSGSSETLGGRDLGLLAAAAIVLMIAISLGQALVALSGHARMGIGWLVALLAFVALTAVGDDLYLRVEAGLLGGAVAAAIWMAAGVTRRLRAHAQATELELADAVAEMPLQP
jgi:O-antigen/teichoic acid export membrane protein